MDPTLKDQLVRSLMRLRKMNLSFPPELDLRLNEFFLLKGVSGNFPCPENNSPLSNLHHHLHITRPAVSQTLNALEKKGYIRREIDQSDRRKISIALTPEGEAVLQRTKEYMDARLNETITRFGEDNARQLIALLTLLADVSDGISREQGTSDNQKGDNELD